MWKCKKCGQLIEDKVVTESGQCYVHAVWADGPEYEDGSFEYVPMPCGPVQWCYDDASCDTNDLAERFVRATPAYVAQLKNRIALYKSRAEKAEKEAETLKYDMRVIMERFHYIENAVEDERVALNHYRRDCRYNQTGEHNNGK